MRAVSYFIIMPNVVFILVLAVGFLFRNYDVLSMYSLILFQPSPPSRRVAVLGLPSRLLPSFPRLVLCSWNSQ